MIAQDKFHKLCKYSIRLKKSLISNDSNDYEKYCSHLKYHIGEQIGNGTNPELDKLFDILTKFINDNNDIFNLGNVEKKLEDNIKTYKIKIQKNELMVEKLNSQIIETKQELMETKNKLLESNSNENIIKKLEELQKIKYEEFIDLLKKLFTQIYDEETANNIIEEIGRAETWKDNEAVKIKRIYTKVNVNGKEYTWNEIICMIRLFQTNGSLQLIADIEKYLDTGEGNVNTLIFRYNTELTKSIEKIKLNSKPNSNQLQSTNNIRIPKLNITGQKQDGMGIKTEWMNKPL